MNCVALRHQKVIIVYRTLFRNTAVLSTVPQDVVNYLGKFVYKLNRRGGSDPRYGSCSMVFLPLEFPEGVASPDSFLS